MGSDPEMNRLLEARQAARERRDFATADAIRDQLRQAGWLVRDTPDGPEVAPAPPYETVDPAALEPRWEAPDRHDVSVVVHVAGWPEDVARAIRALATHHGHLGYEVLLVADGAGEATGRALEDLAREDPRVRVLHLDPAVGFGAAMNLGMGQALGRVLVWLDPHVEATGDLLSPLLAALGRPGAGLAGGWGVTTTSMLEFEADDGPEVDAIEGYLLAVPRALAARVRVDPKDRYYRNADLDYCFAVRALGHPTNRGTPSGFPEPLLATRVEVPATRHRHRGYHDTDPQERDRASRKNYDRFLGRWKGRTDLLTRGFRGYHRHS
ncbi:MAG TPA: glycosyltransferase [Actinomycetota bacterium]|jgi:cysteinyl-tRNA synthetase|nr:glycosyltransferase [Actinomycetota bacterium]